MRKHTAMSVENRHDNSNVEVLLVDFTGSETTGHYLQTAFDLIFVLQLLSVKPVLVSRYADHEKFDELNLKPSDRIRLDGVNEFHVFIERQLMKSKGPIYCFFLWWRSLDQFRTSERYTSSINLRIFTIVNASTWLRGYPKQGVEESYLSSLSADPLISRIYSWDPLAKLQRRFPKLDYLPEIHREVYISNPIRTNEKQIGFYGKLSVDRGLFEVYLAALFHPNRRFRIRGYGKVKAMKDFYRMSGYQSKSQTPFRFLCSMAVCLIAWLLSQLPNIDEKSVEFESDLELVADMKTCKCVFYAANHSPHSSGIALLSLVNEIPVLWIKGNSAASDNLERYYPEGHISFRHFVFPVHLKRRMANLPTPKLIDTEVVQAVKEVLARDLIS